MIQGRNLPPDLRDPIALNIRHDQLRRITSPVFRPGDHLPPRINNHAVTVSHPPARMFTDLRSGKDVSLVFHRPGP